MEGDGEIDGDVEARLGAVVAAVAADLHPGRSLPAISPDSLLDRDLGFDSLGRVELLARLEREFAVALPDEVFANAETPRDLARAVRAAKPSPAVVPPSVPGPAVVAGAIQLPDRARTLIEVLDWHAGRTPERVWITSFADAGDGPVLTFGALRRSAERLAAGLQAAGLPPEGRVALMLPTGFEYFEAFFGILLAGGVPVPLYPPARPSQIGEHLERQAAILDNCAALILLTTAEILPLARLLAGRIAALREVRTVAGMAALGSTFARQPLTPEATAFLQYTSGSTGQPKGVVLSHANLLANIRAMGAALAVGADDVFVSWLPLYHDMGLIGAALGSFYHALPLILMSPLAFLARPQRWLVALSRHGGTLSAAPNFAYELAARRLDDTDLAGLDLSRWRAALNGAEAVSPETLERFAARFEKAGFRRQALMPVYGLAESSVGLAFPPLGRGPRIEDLDRDIFARQGLAVPASTANRLRAVSSGRPLPGHQIRVVDKSGREQPDRREGRIEFKGPSSTTGYFRNPQKTRELFDGDWLETGDLGYMAEGEIFVTGRVKDLIIRAGRNIYPAEIEEAVGELEGVRRGNVAVFALQDSQAGTEKLVVVAESRARGPARETLVSRIAEITTLLAGLPPDAVELTPPGSVLKTSSGKVRRDATRRLYESGKMGAARPAVWLQLAGLALAALRPRLARSLHRAREWLYALWVWSLTGLATPLLWLAALAGSWPVLRLLLKGLARLAGIRLSLQGAEKLPPEGGAVLVANHASYLDGFVLSALLPRPPVFVVKAELAALAAVRLPLSRLGAIFVERIDRARSADDAKRLVERARKGKLLAVFPEGTFTRMTGLLPFHMGAFLAAAEAGVPVVPVTLRGTRAILRSDSWFPRRGRVTVTVGEPMPPPAGGRWEAAISLRDRTRAEILSRLNEPDLAQESVELPQTPAS
ncbi:MAG: AMP-binding protein [Rhodospirillales bacterium]|nr:AMP-binding protein [Rhodospirillales bacterium]